MRYKSSLLRLQLQKNIQKIVDNSSLFVTNPTKHFTRSKKLPLKMTIQSILSMGGQSLSKELFNLELPISVSAFVQRRYHIKVSAFQTLFHDFTKTILAKSPCPILAVDSSDINIPTNPCDKASYFSVERRP